MVAGNDSLEQRRNGDCADFAEQTGMLWEFVHFRVALFRPIRFT